jgi:flavin reductase
MNWIDQRPDDAMDGAFTAVGPGPIASVEPPIFREAMSRLGAAVHVVTTAGIAGKTGFTATAVWAGEEKLADLFAGRSGIQLHERFSAGEWITLKTGAPVLASAVVSFDCRTIETKAMASHNVVFGAVEAVRMGQSGPALVYHERGYKQV